MRIQFPPNLRRSRAGFSLIEVTIALGITAVALVSLMGMLPKGMQTLRRAADQAIEGRIHQQVLGELQLTPWENEGDATTEDGDIDSPVDVFHRQIRFYDDQGIQLEENEKGGVKHIYTARILVPQKGKSLPTSVGGGTHHGVMAPVSLTDDTVFLRLVIVEVTAIVDPRFLSDPVTAFDQAEYQKNIRTFRTFITKMGQEYEEETETP